MNNIVYQHSFLLEKYDPLSRTFEQSVAKLRISQLLKELFFQTNKHILHYTLRLSKKSNIDVMIMSLQHNFKIDLW